MERDNEIPTPGQIRKQKPLTGSQKRLMKVGLAVAGGAAVGLFVMLYLWFMI